MEILLLRHGNAEATAPRDRDRQLSALGREELQRTLELSKQALAKVEHVWVSPYTRARQTCDFAMRFMPQISSESVEETATLTPNANPQQVMRLLENCHNKVILLVSHQPLVGTLLDELCGLEPGRYRMITGAIASLNLDVVARGLGNLNWLHHP